MFRRFLRHKVNRDKGLLLIFPKHPLFPRLLRGTFVGNVKVVEITPRPTPTVASESGRSGERRVAPGGCGEGEHETVFSSQWSVVSESGESGEPTKEECPVPQNVQNEANPESTQSSLPLEVESSVPEPAGWKRSRSTQAVAREQ